MSTHVRRFHFLALPCVALGFLLAAARAEEPPPKEKPNEPPTTAKELIRSWQQGLEVLFPMVQHHREEMARKQIQQNLRQLALELHKYDPPTTLPKNDPAYKGVFEHILPYIEQQNAILPLYVCPSDLSNGNRFGARIEPAPAVLASHLALPKDQGQVIGEVEKGKAADKAGLKQHDILLKLNGKDVPRDADAFTKLLAEIKPDKAVDAVVLREGKRVDVKGIKLPEASPFPQVGANYLLGNDPIFRAPPDLRAWEWDTVRRLTDGTSSTLLFGEKLSRPAEIEGCKVWSKGNPILATTFRNKERFTTRHQEGSLVLTVVGTIKEGKANVGGITVREGNEEKKYAVLDKVPEEYRDKVTQLIELSAK